MIFRLFVKAKCTTHAKTTFTVNLIKVHMKTTVGHSSTPIFLPSAYLEKNQSMIETQKTFIFSVNKSLEKFLERLAEKA